MVSTRPSRDAYAAFHAARNPDNAFHMKRYMKDRSDFFGIKSPERKVISRQIMEELGIPDQEDLKALCRLCFKAEEREMQYFVNDILQKSLKKLDVSFLDLVESVVISLEYLPGAFDIPVVLCRAVPWQFSYPVKIGSYNVIFRSRWRDGGQTSQFAFGNSASLVR